MAEAVLTVGGRRLAGWTEVSVSASIERLAPTFRLSMSERAPGETTPRDVRPGESASVALDGEAVLAGYVDTVRPSYDSTSHRIAVDGRDATGDLSECSAASTPGEWHDATLTDVVSALCAPFGIGVSADAVGEPFRRFRIEEGETVFEAIDRACRMRGLLPLADGRGGLVLGRPVRDRAGVRLERGRSMLAAQGQASMLGRFSEYTILGQQPGDDFLTPQAAAHVVASARDASVSRHRPLTVIAEQALTGSEAAVRVRWERDVRAARSRRVTATVRGWRESGGEGPLWRPGRLVGVVDDWLGLSRALLIVTVVWRRDAGGTLSDLTLLPEQAFSAEPVSEVSNTPEEAASWWR